MAFTASLQKVGLPVVDSAFFGGAFQGGEFSSHLCSEASGVRSWSECGAFGSVWSQDELTVEREGPESLF